MRLRFPIRCAAALPKIEHSIDEEGPLGELHEVAHEIMDAASSGASLEALEGDLEMLAAELGLEGLHGAAEETLQAAVDGLIEGVREGSKISCRQPKGGKRSKRTKTKTHKGVKIRSDKRLAIYLRDGMRCLYCDADLLETWIEDPDSVNLDHVLPRSKRGKDSPINLVTTCRRCNLSRGDKPLHEWTDEATRKKIQRNLRRNVCLLLPLIKAWIIEKAIQREMIKAPALQAVREQAEQRYRQSSTPNHIRYYGALYRRADMTSELNQEMELQEELNWAYANRDQSVVEHFLSKDEEFYLLYFDEPRPQWVMLYVTPDGRIAGRFYGSENEAHAGFDQLRQQNEYDRERRVLLHEARLRRQCAWCNKWLDEKPAPTEAEFQRLVKRRGITHGMCTVCEKKWNREIDERYDRVQMRRTEMEE